VTARLIASGIAIALINCKTQPAPPVLSEFELQLAPKLEARCASEKGCHGAEPAEAMALDLRRPFAAKELIGQPSDVRKGALLVQPANPGASFLLDKLSGRLAKGEGKKMPLDPQTGASLPETPEQLELAAALTRWIQDGAAP
jgi:hypothetical protein